MGWIGAVVAVVGSVAKSAADKKAADKANQQGIARTDKEAVLQRQNSQFNAEQDYYYRQLEKQEKMRGLDEFRKFSTVKNYMQDYQQTNAGPTLPGRPQFDEGAYAKPAETPKGPKGTMTGLKPLKGDLGGTVLHKIGI